ncbi:P-loop NTPase [Anaerotignum lactatifermentans]|uniref:Iron-sulfur cluster carrier protein n=1 Tax=Anaerotignum lactatifermentans TaxID=160404 RepID=A0ABS2G8J7_9FIRM|nr:Mrp/NBP35 family ATP-binding protein [Anaerotignum lactatifermentans]MBM6829438.1 P-loop NTPase [Anaerotignum lactatifermentans]MBM6877796.1 P-loop NTPase [Anaerotignum lactatifermentans]MBM6951015.1 P-loop NTPase [Anaerotignum lactatifermentans]
MSESCSHDCGSCSSNCGHRKPADFLVAPHPSSNIKKVIGVVSGKGGVGKSMVTSTMAVLMQRKGKQTAILDADITGPSIPKAFGMKEKAYGTEAGMLPCKTRTGIDVMSVNLLLDNETDPVVWRGPIIGETVKQFWSEVIWENEDYMFIDMPPGTGDVALTVFQSIAIDGIIIVTSPQELVGMIVDKAVKMAEMMNVPILGIVENLSYFVCPDCGSQHKIFGESHIEEIAAKHNIPVVCKLPINPEIAARCDRGDAEDFEGDWLDPMVKFLELI